MYSYAQTPTLIFNSGFEPNLSKSPVTFNTEDIIGKDVSFSSKNDWVTDLNQHPNVGYFTFQYDDAADTCRNMRFVKDPKNSNNNVLQFWAKYPSVAEGKSRVQASMYKNTDLKNIFYSVKMFLPGDFNNYKKIKKQIDWMTIMEFWNEPNWLGDKYPFRVSVNIRKMSKNVDSLRLRAYGQIYDEVVGKWLYVWDTTNMSYVLPVGKWTNLEVHIIEGNKSTGRFNIKATTNGQTSTIFDVKNFTYHPLDNAPDGFSHLNPFKMYTSSDVVDSMRVRKSLLNILWDDFIIYKDKPLVLSVNDEDYSNKGFVYFNPIEKKLTLLEDSKPNQNKIISIYDLQGKLLLENNLNKNYVDLEYFKNGLYVYRIIDDDNSLLTGKFKIE